MARLAFLGVALAIPALAGGEIWKCGKQYTSDKTGKTGCVPAGGVKSCGSDGNRYFSPGKSSSSSDNPCHSSAFGISPFVDMKHQKGTVIPAPEKRLRGVRRPDERAANQEGKHGSLQDLFSCDSHAGTLHLCGVSGVGQFVRETFLDAARAINQ